MRVMIYICPCWLFINPVFLSFFFNTPDYRSQISQNVSGIAQPKCNATKLKELVLPFLLLPEQQEIVRRVDALFAFADSIEAKVAVAREKMERLRQSILAKAFSGELVPTEAELAMKSEAVNQVRGSSSSEVS